MITLAIDASTYVGTAALFDDGKLMASSEAAMRGKDAERLFPMVLDVIRGASRDVRDVEEIVCGAGPGSFTSLRIAASLAKGLAFGLGIGIRPVSSLGLIVAEAAREGRKPRYLAAIDALRGEFYVQRFAILGEQVAPEGAFALAPASDLEAMARREDAELVGPEIGAKWAPHARGALRLAASECVDLASWEPSYGRQAEAQSRWEAAHGRSLPV